MLVPYASGNWNNAANAGVFYRYWAHYRSYDFSNCGFRCAAYGQ